MAETCCQLIEDKTNIHGLRGIRPGFKRCNKPATVKWFDNSYCDKHKPDERRVTEMFKREVIKQGDKEITRLRTELAGLRIALRWCVEELDKSDLDERLDPEVFRCRENARAILNGEKVKESESAEKAMDKLRTELAEAKKKLERAQRVIKEASELECHNPIPIQIADDDGITMPCGNCDVCSVKNSVSAYEESQ